MAQLSELVALVKKMRSQQHGQVGPRTGTAPTALRGFTRGAIGSSGARLFKGRNSAAGAQKELKMLESPVMKAYMQQTSPSTPMTDYLRGKV